MAPLVLASTSPWRKRLLEAAGLHLRTEPSDVDERALEAGLVRGVPPEHRATALARGLALEKARVVARRCPGCVVLGADQVGHDPGRPGSFFGKPSDPEDHRAGLLGRVGRPHILVTGFALVGPEGAEEEVGHVSSTLWMRSDLTEAEIAAYVATGEGSECAGGYAAGKAVAGSLQSLERGTYLSGGQERDRLWSL